MEGCLPVPATSADTPQPTTTTTPLALAVAAAEATSTAIANMSSDMSLSSALESSCTLSDPTPTPAVDNGGGAAASLESANLHLSSRSAPLIDASNSEAPSCSGGCTGPASSTAGAEAGTGAPMTSIDEPPSSYTSTTTNSNTNTNTTATNSNKKKRRVVRIDIYSDTTCPWCYITKKRLEKAIQAFQLASSSSSNPSSSDSALLDSNSASAVVHEGCTSDPQPPSSSAQSSSDPSSATTSANPRPLHQQHQQEQQEIHFDIHWRPFQLDPNAPRIPIRKTKLYHRKFGTEKALQVQDRVVAAGKVEGILFSYTDQSLYSNTIDSHRLLRFARERLGRLPVDVREEAEVEGRRKMVDSGNALSASYHHHHQDQDQDQQGYFPTYTSSTAHNDNQEEEETYPSTDNDEHEEEEEEEVDEIGARMEDAMVDELFRSHFERGECSEYETLKSCARSVLIQTAAFSAAAALSLSSSAASLSSSAAAPSLPSTTTSAEFNSNNTNESTQEEHYTRLLKAKEQELIDQQIQELDAYLHSDEDLDEVMEEIRVAKEDLGMQGVPMIIIQNEYLLSGAQSSATFVQVLQRVI